MIPPGQMPTTQLLDGIPPPKRKPSTSTSGTPDPKKTRDDYLAKLKGENKQVWRAVVVLDKSLCCVNHGGERLQGEGTAEEWNDWVKQQDWAALLSSLNQILGGIPPRMGGIFKSLVLLLLVDWQDSVNILQKHYLVSPSGQDRHICTRIQHRQAKSENCQQFLQFEKRLWLWQPSPGIPEDEENHPQSQN